MNIVTIIKNEYNTFFVFINGLQVAHSSTIKRQRGFWNSVTKQFACGKKFTKRNIQKDPYMVLGLLDATGTDITQGMWSVTAKIDRINEPVS